MAETKHTILCGECDAVVEGSSNPEPQDIITCPNCGNSDNFENVIEACKAYMLEQTKASFNQTMTKMARSSKIVHIEKPFNSQIKKHRFKLDLQA